MGRGIIIGLDLAEPSFQVHGSGANGEGLFRKKLRRAQVLAVFAEQPRCTVAMEACATAPDWGREIGAPGDEVKLIPPISVKPFVKRQKDDVADAEAITEAASRPTMRTVAVRPREQQSRSTFLRTRDLRVRQRTQLINALRAHLAEYGSVAPKQTMHVPRLAAILEDGRHDLPPVVAETDHVCLDQIAILTDRINALQKQMRAAALQDETAHRLQTMPGICPVTAMAVTAMAVTAMAVTAFALPMETFWRGQDFAAWLGVVPKQHSTGGRQRLGTTSKTGQRDIRRLLVIGAMSVVRAAIRRHSPPFAAVCQIGSWTGRTLGRKPRRAVAIALANRMARQVWAMLMKTEDDRDPIPAA